MLAVLGIKPRALSMSITEPRLQLLLLLLLRGQMGQLGQGSVALTVFKQLCLAASPCGPHLSHAEITDCGCVLPTRLVVVVVFETESYCAVQAVLNPILLP